MAVKNPVNGVLNYVLGKYVTTERIRQGLQTGTRASFHMEEADTVTLLGYMASKSGCTVDQAVKNFTDARTAVVQAKAKSPKEMGFFSGLLISFFVTMIPIVFLNTLKGNMWLRVALLAATLMLFFGFVLLLAWRPRNRAMNAAWNTGETLADRLEKLHEIQEMSFMDVIREYQKPQGTVFMVIALVCILGLPAALGNKLAVEEAFHKEMCAVVVSADNAGTRYVVYDVDDGMYVDKYLSDARQAASASEVRGVLRIDEDERVVGRYEGQGNAYQRYVTIELVDQKTGQTVMRKTVYGGDPPRSISVKAGTRNQNGYGSHPSTEDIARTCEDMIYTFERSGK